MAKIDYDREKEKLGTLVTVGQFVAWMTALRARTLEPAPRNGLLTWIERTSKLPQGVSLVSVEPDVGNLYGIGINLLNQAAGKPATYGSGWADAMIPDGGIDWGKTWDAAQRKWRTAVQSDPEKFKNQAETFIERMKATRRELDAIKPLIRTSDEAARFNRLAREYWEISDRFKTDSEGFTGLAPLLIVAGIAFGAAALAWATGISDYLSSLLVRAKTEREELEARYALAREGKKLPPSTLPPPAPPKPGIDWKVWAPIVGIVVAGAVAAYVTRGKQ